MPNIHPKHYELWHLLKQILDDTGLDDDEVTLAYQCHLYATSGGKFFVGHRLIIIVYKLVHYIAKQKRNK